MAISLTKLALGAAAVAILVVPALPANWLPDIMHAPSKSAIPQIAESGARLAGELLVSSALADETILPPAIDFSALVKISDEDYVAYHDESVSTEILSETNIRKIGYGRTTRVAIVKTPTGTYSSDALASPHVQYPGIDVELDPNARKGVLGAFWSSGIGWVGIPVSTGRSIITYGKMNGGGSYLTTGGSNCFSGRGYLICS